MNSKKFQRAALMTTCLTMVLSFTGCGKQNLSYDSQSSTPATSSGSTTASSGTTSENGLPLVTEPVTLTYFVPFSSEIITSLADNTMYQELEKRTGVHIEWQHPAGDANQAFQLLLTSSDLPDIVEDCMQYYPSGPDRLVDDGIALQLNDLIDQYAPAYKKILDDYPQIYKECVTDTGKMVTFSCVQTVHEDPWTGYSIRQDWLDELNLDMPTTVDELTEVLRAFKTQKGASVPMTWYDSWKDQYGYFVGAWGVGPKFYNENGTVKYGPAELGYKQYVETMRMWYAEGLLDPEYLTRDSSGRDELIGNNQTGVCNGTSVSALQDTVVAMPYVTLEKGETRHFSNWVTYTKPANECFITTSCKDPELAVRWFDYHYTEEGSFLFNYGVEGICHEIVDGKPQFTELMTNNPDGFAPIYMNYVHKWHQGAYNRDFLASPGTTEKYISDCAVWASNTDGAYVMPPITMTTEEGTEFSSIMADINTYVDEMTAKFIMGLEPMENYDSFVETIRGMNLETAIADQQAALDRYNAR